MGVVGNAQPGRRTGHQAVFVVNGYRSCPRSELRCVPSKTLQTDWGIGSLDDVMR